MVLRRNFLSSVRKEEMHTTWLQKSAMEKNILHEGFPEKLG